MIAAHQFSSLTPNQYLEWENHQELRHEYFDGDVFAMAGGTISHGIIGVNLASILKGHLRGKGCLVLNSDCKVGITDNGPFTYPDLSVSCDDRDRTATQFSRYPCLIIEVLSPSTEAYDRGGKFKLYRQLESLQEYVLISSENQIVEIFRRNQWGIWSYQPFENEDVELTSIDLSIPIESIYEDVTFR